MGIKERMMDGMMDKMSPEEKLRAMETMMQKFLEGLSPEERRKMMEGMMEKFMGGMSAEERGGLMAGMMPRMMGEAGPMGMMGMMRMMMGAGKGAETGGEMPWDMCRKMLGAMTEGAQTARFATPEVRGLFDEWAAQIEEEMLQFAKKAGEVDVDKAAEHFKLSKESTIYFLTRLAQKGKIRFGNRSSRQEE